MHPSVVTSLYFPEVVYSSQANTFKFKMHLELNISYTPMASFPAEWSALKETFFNCSAEERKMQSNLENLKENIQCWKANSMLLIYISN